jgi:putative transposase
VEDGRSELVRDSPPGAGCYRNGCRPGRVKSAEGAIEYSAPQIADRSEPLRSRIREIVGGWAEALEAMAVESATNRRSIVVTLVIAITSPSK